MSDRRRSPNKLLPYTLVEVPRKTADSPHSFLWTPVDDQILPLLVLPANAMV